MTGLSFSLTVPPDGECDLSQVVEMLRRELVAEIAHQHMDHDITLIREDHDDGSITMTVKY